MATVPCNFTIPADSPNGGGLAGNGFNGRPTLNSGDILQVIVRCAGSSGPANLTGRFIFSPAGDAPSSQTAPSPFLSGSKYVCYTTQTKPQDSGSGGSITYTFDGITYGGGQQGNFELTFVAEDGSTAPPTQWSEDPEFDTGG